MMLYKNTKANVHSLDWDTDVFDIVAFMLQGDTLARYLFIICQNYVLWISIDLIKENSFALPKARSERYLASRITDSDYADDIALLANTLVHAESLLHSQEQAAGGIGFHVYADKTEFRCFNQRGDISTLNGRSVKLADKFHYLGSSY